MTWITAPILANALHKPSEVGEMRAVLCGAATLLLIACQGPRGAAGERGPVGKNGMNGADGSPGARGMDGAKGEMGAIGPAGGDGVDGAPGAKGDTGERGAVGAKGPAGDPGPPGINATSSAGYRPLFWLGCATTLDLVGAGGGLGQDGTKESAFVYHVTIYSDGDVDLQCEASLGAAASATAGGYYALGTVAAHDGTCDASVDYPPSGGVGSTVGLWHFEIRLSAPKGPRATYVDPDSGHPLNGHFYQFAENDCTVLHMKSDDTWADSSLAEAFP